MRYILSFIFSFWSLLTIAQLEDGSTAPDFTLVDWYGGTHNLYDYLDENKTVFVEIFAAHCPGCWSYHETERLKNMYLNYGPDGTDEVMVLALEHDEYNDEDEWIGIGPEWVAQGNWLEGTPYPQFNVEWPDRGVFEDYNVTFYPIVYKICPNRVLERVNTSSDESALYDLVQACEPLNMTENVSSEWRFLHYNNANMIEYSSDEKYVSLNIYTAHGSLVKEYVQLTENRLDISFLNAGMYILQFKNENGLYTEKIGVW